MKSGGSDTMIFKYPSMVIISRLSNLLSCLINPIQQGGGGEGGAKSLPPTSFFPVTSTNVGISPKIFLTFSFNSFATLV